MSGVRWFSDVYRNAVWEAETLTAVEKAVAETYARHVRDSDGRRSAEADLAWLTYERIMAKAGIRRRANVAAATASLVKAGWLVVHQEVNRRPTVYRIAVPLLGSSTTGTTDASSDGGTTVVPLSDHGSSTLSDSTRPGSSDGGTPPLEVLPLKRSPSSSSGRAPTEAIRARLGADLDDDEVDWIEQRIKDMAGGPIRKSFAAYLGGIPDADLDEYRRQYRDREPDIYDVPWCGDCDGSKTRRVSREGSYGQGLIRVACPTCNPHRYVPLGQPPEPRREPGGYKPYRNPTDPNAYDSYLTGPSKLRGQDSRAVWDNLTDADLSFNPTPDLPKEYPNVRPGMLRRLH
jgi:hypothetical protein